MAVESRISISRCENFFLSFYTYDKNDTGYSEYTDPRRPPIPRRTLPAHLRGEAARVKQLAGARRRCAANARLELHLFDESLALREADLERDASPDDEHLVRGVEQRE